MEFQKKVNSLLDIKPTENQFVEQALKVSSEIERKFYTESRI